MCIEHEPEYRGCFDFLFLEMPDLNEGPTMQSLLLQRVGAKVVDEHAFQREVQALLDRLHVVGIIRPSSEEEDAVAQHWRLVVAEEKP